MATTSQTTPENAPKNDKDNSNESGQGLDAKGFVDSPANEVGQGRNLQLDLSALNNSGLSPIQQSEATEWAKSEGNINPLNGIRFTVLTKSN